VLAIVMAVTVLNIVMVIVMIASDLHVVVAVVMFFAHHRAVVMIAMDADGHSSRPNLNMLGESGRDPDGKASDQDERRQVFHFKPPRDFIAF
jgi:hypothetical protein